MHHDFLIDHHRKSYPLGAAPCLASELAQKQWSVLADELAYPLAVLRRSALEHNLAWMQDFARRKGVDLAPHGKTTMAPALFAQQLQAGAWGMTVATVFQLAVCVQAGARRVIVANQLLADADLDGLRQLLEQHTGLRVWFLVDSQAQLALIEDWAMRRAYAGRLDVLLEMGIAGQRTGCRTLDEAVALAQAMARSTAVRFGGLECYEGSVARCDTAHDAREITALVRRVSEVARACDAQGLLPPDEVLVTAGGSAVFDLVVPMLRMQGLSRPVRGVLRSGCYITHDHGSYKRYLAQVEQREGLDSSLRPALEVWALVQSMPEPGLALLSCGRRDISYDTEMPIPARLARRGMRSAESTPANWKITALNDQHAFLRFDPEGTVPRVGDRVALGVSHPCTTFDKWSWMVVAEDDWRITGAIQTFF